MVILWIAIAIFIVLIVFLAGFIMGSQFTKAYLRANGLLLDEPKPEAAKGCGKGGCDCGS